MSELYKETTPLTDEEYDEYVSTESKKLMAAILTLTQPYDEEVLTITYAQCFITTASIFAFKNEIQPEDFREFIQELISDMLDDATPPEKMWEALRTGNTTGVVN